MSLKYSLYDTPVPGDRENKRTKHARVVYNGTVNMYMLCKLISSSSSFSAADVKGILEAFTQWMGVYLADGSIICLEGLGHFYPTLRSNNYIDKEGKQFISVRPDTIGFRCSPILKGLFRKAELEEEKREVNKKWNIDERWERIISYLKKYEYINFSEVMALNNCTRYVALEDLNKLRTERKVRRIGRARQTMYVLCEIK